VIEVKKISFLIGILILFLVCSMASAAEIDKTNGQPVAPAKMLMSVSSSPVCDAQSETCKALWDISHGVYLDYQPSGDYSEFVGLLNSLGYPVAVTSSGVLTEDLSKYDILIVATTTSWDSPYSAGEVAAIKTFVDNGGKLLILGENTDCPNGNINPVSQAFGITTGISYLTPIDLYITNFASHPLFTGISTINFAAGGELSSTGTIAWTDSKLPAIDVAEMNHVVVIGDSNIFDNIRMGYSDNAKLASNLWTSVFCPPQAPEFPSLFIPITFIIGLLGAVLLIKSTR
jgi:hypothetical protein